MKPRPGVLVRRPRGALASKASRNVLAPEAGSRTVGGQRNWARSRPQPRPSPRKRPTPQSASSWAPRAHKACDLQKQCAAPTCRAPMPDRGLFDRPQLKSPRRPLARSQLHPWSNKPPGGHPAPEARDRAQSNADPFLRPARSIIAAVTGACLPLPESDGWTAYHAEARGGGAGPRGIPAHAPRHNARFMGRFIRSQAHATGPRPMSERRQPSPSSSSPPDCPPAGYGPARPPSVGGPGDSELVEFSSIRITGPSNWSSAWR
jgi:hypothetical protein